mmetsp:Transcript_6473/g.7990  ORF Transcript_6473/g.7990 Transcript_6473/m.7990 type:complete len:89 (+) Transcript_6473:782-1048(+)
MIRSLQNGNTIHSSGMYNAGSRGRGGILSIGGKEGKIIVGPAASCETLRDVVTSDGCDILELCGIFGSSAPCKNSTLKLGDEEGDWMG